MQIMPYRGRFISIVLLLVVLGAGALRPTSLTAQEPIPCAVTPDLIEGLGFNVATVGLGFNVATVGLGFNVATVGLGFNVATVGLDSDRVTEELLEADAVDFNWLVDYMRVFYQPTDALNDERSAVIILDNQAHGQYVLEVFNQADKALEAAFGATQVDVFVVDIGLGQEGYNNQVIANRLQQTVDDLRSEGYERFVVNMSFGMIVCETDIDTLKGEFPFNFATALNIINGINATATAPDPKLITPMIECITRDEKNGLLTAHITYTNDNATPQIVPFGSNNRLRLVGGGGGTVNLPSEDTPTFFYRNTTLPGQPGQSLSYPDAPIQITFPENARLQWEFNDIVYQADIETPNCSPQPSPLGNSASNSVVSSSIAVPSAASDLIPVVQCVQFVPDEGRYQAHFGIVNNLGRELQLPAGGGNFIAGTPYSGPTPATLPTIFGNVAKTVGPYPQSAFSVYFDTSVDWNLNGNTATATPSSRPCLNPRGYSLQNYLVEYGAVPLVQVLPVLTDLFQQGNSNDSDLQQLLRRYLEEAESAANDEDTDTRFQMIPVASSGNFAPFIAEALRIEPGEVGPLAPASWPETIAVAATFPDDEDLWDFSGTQFTHNGEVAVPGGVYIARDPRGGEIRLLGTSFAAPVLSRLLATKHTYPEGCIPHFDEVQSAFVPPIQLPGLYDNSLLRDGPTFDCGLPIPGDCNFDGAVNAADLSALAREISDRDGSDRNASFLGSYYSNPLGCDARADGAVSEADRACIRGLLFNPGEICK